MTPYKTEELFEVPDFAVLGTLDELVLEGGNNNDDGWGWTKMPSVDAYGG